MKTKRDDRTTASRCRCGTEITSDYAGRAPPLAIVPNNRAALLAGFGPTETLALGQLLDRLDALEEAVRVRPNARALAALREQVEAMLEIGGSEPGDNLADHAAAILLNMLDKVRKVAP